MGQGKIIAPHTYKCYVNPLLNQLQTTGLGHHIGTVYLGCPTCADDIVLIAGDTVSLQAQIDIVSTYAAKERYVIHPDKSAYVTYNVKHPQPIEIVNKQVTPSDKATHLGIDRYKEKPCHDGFINDRLSLARRTAYSLMGTGFHGVNGISPDISIKIYQCYVIPRMLYGLEAIVLTSKQQQLLERQHRKILRQLQSLPTRTATCAVLLASGSLPIEAVLDTQIACLLHNISQLDDKYLVSTGLYQLSCNSPNSKSWFVYTDTRLARYGLKATDILQGLTDKPFLKRTIRNKSFLDLCTEAADKSSLQYLDPGICKPGKRHPVWTTVHCNPTETRQAIVKAKLLTGTYVLQCTKSAFNQHSVDPTCKLCAGAIENVTHFLLLCPALALVHDKYLPLIQQLTGLRNTEEQVQIIIDPYNSPGKRGTDRLSDKIVAQLVKLTNTFVYSLHCKRQAILNLCS